MTALCGVRGEQHPNARLTDGQVREIFRRAWAREPQRIIAKKFGINQRLVSAIKLGKRWKHLGLKHD